MNRGNDVGIEIQRDLRWLVVATVFLYLALIAAGVWVYADSSNKSNDLVKQNAALAKQNERLSKQSADLAKQSERLAKEIDRTTKALCSLRGDIQGRVDQAEKFLADHPEGFAGITPATIRQTLKGQKSTVKSLSNLDCPIHVHR